MGGYAAFIWPAFALTAVIMVGLAVSSLRELRAQQKTLRDLEAESPRRRRRAAAKDDRP
ncbi:MAG: heme exporter protein CcmD [Rhodospirillales bacterium]|nr:heme exporter protein CcmD [Rhodospirillales bacterium]